MNNINKIQVIHWNSIIKDFEYPHQSEYLFSLEQLNEIQYVSLLKGLTIMVMPPSSLDTLIVFVGKGKLSQR